MVLEHGGHGIELQLGTAYEPVEPMHTRKNTAFRGDIQTDEGRVTTILKLLRTEDIVREALCWVLARSLDLPTPQAYLVQVDPAVVNGRYEGNPEKLAFGSKETGRSRQLHRDEEQEVLRNWPLTTACAVFDLWIHCTDRYPGNLIFDVNDGIWLIDHEEALPHFAQYDSVSNSTLFRMLEKECNEFELRFLRREAEIFARRCADVDLDVLQAMIERQFPHGSLGNQISRHIKFLGDRAEELPGLVAKSLGLSRRSSILNGNTKEEKEKYE